MCAAKSVIPDPLRLIFQIAARCGSVSPVQPLHDEPMLA